MLSRRACERRGGPRRRSKVQKGGRNPYYVDFKKGINVTKKLIKDLKKPVNETKAKAMVAGCKRQY